MKRFYLLLIMLKMGTFSLFCMEPEIPQDDSNSQFKIFQFIPMPEALRLVNAVQTISLEEAYELVNHDFLTAVFVIMWNQPMADHFHPQRLTEIGCNILKKIECIQALLLLSMKDGNYQEMCEKIFFYAAGNEGWVEVVEFFVSHGYHINHRGTYQRTTALHEAVRWTHLEAVELLLNNDVRVNNQTQNETALDTAKRTQEELSFLCTPLDYADPCFVRMLPRNERIIQLITEHAGVVSNQLSEVHYKSG